MDYGTLRVTTPDGQVREYPLDTESVVIGRAESNRVVIDHVSVSRRHARLALDGTKVELEDLGSASGTFVGGERLVPETPRAIKPGDGLRFGDAQAVFMVAAPDPVAPDPVAPVVAAAASPAPAATVTPTPAAGPSPPVVDRSRAPMDQAVVISLVSPAAAIEAGATTSATCILQNRGAEADRVSLAVQNLPEGWSRITRPAIDLPPGGRDEVTILLQPPRTAEAKAGEYALTVAAASTLRGIEVRALGKLTILPFARHSIELTPVRSTGAFTLKVTNEGNAPASVALSGRAQTALNITVRPETLELEPGQQLAAKVGVRPEDRRFFGKEEIVPFEIESRDGRTTDMASGELRSRPPWLTVRWFVAAVAVAAIGIGGFVAYAAISGDDDKAPPSASATAAATKPPETASAPASPSASAAASATATPTSDRSATATLSATVATPTNLPSVTPPSVQSRLGSGLVVQVITATNLLSDPTGSAHVLQPLKVGDRLVVVTNTPTSSTFVITEGLIFWRVLAQGTNTVGWAPEVTTAGNLRYLDVVR